MNTPRDHASETPRYRAACVALALACAGGLGVLTSCAGNPDQARVSESVRSASAIEAPERRLEALAELEAFGSGSGSRLLTEALRDAVAIIDPSFPAPIEPGTEVYRRAARPLQGVLDGHPLPVPAGDLPLASDENRRLAVRNYTRARADRLAGDSASAIVLLEEAVDLDPAASALWSELGRAFSDEGDLVGAIDAYRTAVELGDRDQRSMLTLASDAATRSDASGVILWAGAVLASDPGRRSPESVIAGAMLGSALLERGNLRAGAEVLGESLELFDARRSAGEPLELTRLRARRSEFAVLAGDAWAALGQPGAALDAYRGAGYKPGDEPPVIVQRSLASTVATGRPATAALALLERLGSGGDLGVEESQWVRGLAGIDRVGDALAGALSSMVSDADAPTSVRRQRLRTAVRGLPDAGTALRMIIDAGPVARSPVIAGDLLWRTDPADRLEASIRAVGADPMLARSFGSALSRLEQHPGDLATTLIGSGDPGYVLLGLGICLETGNPGPGESIIGGATTALPDAGLPAQVAAMLGRWDEADRWLDAARIQARNNPDRRAQFVSALLTGARLSEALAIGAVIDTDDDATTDDLLSAAEAAFVVGDEAALRARIGRAQQLDPYDERVLERVLAFANEDAASDEGISLRAFGRELSERRPRSALFTLLRARDMGGRGRLREAVELIMAVGDREPSRDLGVLLLAQAGRAAGTQGDSQTQGLATDWLAARAERLPGSVPTAVAYAQALVGSDPRAALSTLDDAYARIGHDELARNAEAMLATEEGLANDESLTGPGQRVLERTQGRQGSDALIERLGVFVRFGDAESATRAAADALPGAGSFTRAQHERWDRGMQALSRASLDGATLGTPADPGMLVDLIDRAETQGGPVGLALSEGLEQARLLLLVRMDDTDRLGSMIDRQALGEGTGLLVVQAMLSGDRVGAGIDLLARLALSGDEPDAPLLDEWSRLVGAAGDASNIEALLGLVDDAGALGVAGVLRTRFELAALPGAPGAAHDRADIAYTGALLASVFGRETEAEGMHRLALSLHPDHAWACNDLGYSLAERGVMLDEAERLALRANSLLGERASVLDTLAWVRYKLGVLDDETDAGGAVTRAGAISLLARASELEDGGENATIFRHLGDARWRAGHRDEALAAWSRSESLLRARAIEIANSENPSGRASSETTNRLNDVRRRISDAESGLEPETERIPSLDPKPDSGADAGSDQGGVDAGAGVEDDA